MQGFTEADLSLIAPSSMSRWIAIRVTTGRGRDVEAQGMRYRNDRI
jgi:hypothetical protein